MRCLQTLQLSKIPFTMAVVRRLGQFFCTLPSSISKLQLEFVHMATATPSRVHGYRSNTQSSMGGDASRGAALERILLFRAIALVRSLQNLSMPQWEVIVGDDAHACTEPLRGLPQLKKIHVRKVRSTAAFPTCFKFSSSTLN